LSATIHFFCTWIALHFVRLLYCKIISEHSIVMKRYLYLILCLFTLAANAGNPPVAAGGTINISTTVTNVSCFGGNNGAIDLTVTGGVAPYSYLWSNTTTVEDPIGLTAGTYTVTVTDNVGETQTASATVGQPTAINATTTITNVLCFGGSNGTIDLTVTGGTPPYTYNWSTTATTQDITNLTAGTYTVTITDANACTKIVSATVSSPTALFLSTAVANIFCYGASNGFINLTVSGGIPPYTYLWSNGSTQQDPVNLVAGTYTVTITDANGCTKTTTRTVTQPAAINLAFTAVNNICYGTSNGSINMTVTGGFPPYVYDWSDLPGTNNPEDRTNLPVGVYTVTVIDANGCTKTAATTITQPGAPINQTCIKTQPDCGQTNGSLDLTVTGGTGPYNYNWSDLIGNNDPQDRSNISAQVYFITVTDVNGCSQTAFYELPDNNGPTLSLQPSPVSCTGLPDGYIDLTVSGGSAPYLYLWSMGNTTEDVNMLAKGKYFVSVTDNAGCFAFGNADIISAPPIVLSGQITQPLCTNTGLITLTVANGTQPFTYDWSNDGPDAVDDDPKDLSGLAAGTYTVTVTDAGACTQVSSFTLTAGSIGLAFDNTHLSCNSPGMEGAINLSVDPLAAQPITYDWEDLPGNADPEDRTQLNAGLYSVTVTDANGCTATQSDSIFQGILIFGSVTNSSCFVGGSISLIAINIALPAVYDWADIPGTNNPQNRSGLAAGIYTVSVTDAVGCTASATFTIAGPPQINITGVVSSNCSGPNSATIDISVSGGAPPYTYAWSNGNTTQDLTSVSSGTYTVTVTGSNGCTSFKSFTVTTSSPIVLPASQVVITNVSCFGLSDGAIAITPSGGTLPYAYNWTGPNAFTVNTQNLTNIPAGNYSLTITDANGCTLAPPPYQVTQPAQLQFSPPVFCNWEVTAQVFGGTPPYGYGWPGGGNGPTVTLAPGTYTLTVTDSKGCSATDQITMDLIPDACTKITGNVIQDANDDCLLQAGETGIAGWFVRATGAQTYYGVTDAAGNYTIRVEPGNYVVSLIPNGNLPAVICSQDIPASVPAVGDEAVVDFPVQDVPQCAVMTVDMSIASLRRCFSSGYYQIQYCNNGVVAATDAYIVITVDPLLAIWQSQNPYTSLGNGKYRFDLGTVDAGACGTFWARVTVSCDAILGQSLCSQAHIYPDAPCSPNSPNWSGAKVEVSSRCNTDSLRFVLKNTGTNIMSNELEYIVIEDGIMGLQGMSPPLPPGDSMVISLPATGSTWRIEANQEPFTPGHTAPKLSVEGCSTGAFSTGYVSQFSLQDADPWLDEDCTVVTGSYDPNDKQGFPIGYGAAHAIEPGTDIEYMIRFQNTGTDTAFRVRILDTLSSALDLTRVTPGASSHSYRFSVTDPNVLVFDFQDIMLPDSNKDEVNSHGFVKFRVAQRDSLPLGTDILNSAAIYFDFNDPVITNTTTHKVAKNFVLVRSWQPVRPVYQLKISPNPFRNQAFIEVKNCSETGAYRLALFNLEGNLIRVLESETPRFLLERAGMDAGLYFFKIDRNGTLIGTGKVMNIE
jgi:uncharacterized repeat protein (TIGR01451 family)